MDIQAIATQVAEAIKEAPEKAQELVSDPKAAIEGITGESGFDVTEAVQAILAKVGDMGLDLSSLDLSKLNLSQIDIAKLDVSQLKDVAGKLGIDTSKLDLGGIAGKVLGEGGLGGMLGGLFGKK